MGIGHDKNGIAFSEYLKTLFVEFHDEVFTKDENNGGYYHPYHASGSNLMLLKVVYGLLDHEGYEESRNAENDYYGEAARRVVDLVYEYVNSADYAPPSNTVTLDDGTVAQFEFEVLNPKNETDKQTHQRFFSYKVQYFREIAVDAQTDVTLNAAINPYAQNGVATPYAWSKSGSEEIITEESGILELKSVSSSDQGRYLCVVTDEMNTQTSYYFDLKINGSEDEPIDDVPTVSWADGTCATVNEGESATLKVNYENAAQFKWYSVAENGTRAMRMAKRSARRLS